MQRSVSWLGRAVFTAMLVFTGCGGDDGADADGGTPEGGSAGSGAVTGGASGKAGSAGKGGSGGEAGSAGKGGTASGSGGDDGETAGAGGDPSGGSGESGTAGSGAGEAGLGGEGGDDTGTVGCTAGNCCLHEGAVCVAIPDGVHVSVTSSSANPDLGTGVTVAAGPIDVDFLHDPSDPITVTVTIEAGLDPQIVVVVHVDADGHQTDVDATVSDGEVTFVAGEDGTYVVGVIDTTPPAGCAPSELTGAIQVRSDLEADLITGVTRIDGDLSISGAVSNLAALSCLTHVTGNVTLSDTTALAVLPLPHLAVVGGRVSLSNGPLLAMVAFTRLRKVGATEMESVVLTALPQLFSVDFRRLVHAPGSVVMSAIAESSAEPLTMAFSDLASVGGDVNLTLGSSASDAFGALRHVRGSVALSTTGGNVSGFASLETIGGALSLYVPAVEVVRFDALTSVGSVETQELWPLSLDVTGSAGLSEVGFPLLTRAPGSVFVSGGSPEVELSLDLALEEVGGALWVDVAAETASLSSLLGLTRVDGDLRLFGSFPNVDLPVLESVGGTFAVDSETAVSVSAAALTSIGTSLAVRSCPALADLDLGALSSVNVQEGPVQYTINLQGLPALTNVDLSSIGEVGGHVQFANVGNGSLSLRLASLTRVRGDLIGDIVDGSRFDTSALKSVDGSILMWDLEAPLEFGALETIGGQLAIQGDYVNTHLDLSSLASVGGTSPLGPGSIILSSMYELEHVDLSSLASTPSHFRLASIGAGTDQPLTLNLALLTAIGGDLEIAQTSHLANADAFSGLTRIGQHLSITENDILTRVDALNGLTEVTGNLVVSRNPVLPTCGAEALATHLDGVTFSGSVTISYNLADACD